MKKIPSNLYSLTNTKLNNLFIELSCELYKYNYGNILYEIYLRILRDSVLAELTRRNEQKKFKKWHLPANSY